MLPLSHKIAFLLFALITLALGLEGFYRLYLRIRRGMPDPEPRFNNLPRRLIYAITTTLLQTRTFKKRPIIGIFHSFIFYGFVFYGLVNLVDAIEGYLPLTITSANPIGAIYNLLADILSFLVLLGVIALVIRRFALPSRRDFRFNPRTLLHKDVQHSKITRDSLIVSAFILFHVGSRAIGAGARIAAEGPDALQPFATTLSHLFTPANAEAFRIFGYWGALGSVLAFLAYFPYTKHIHIFGAPAKYLVAREPTSGVLPPVTLNLENRSRSRNPSHRRKQTRRPRLAPPPRRLRLHPVQPLPGRLPRHRHRQIPLTRRARNQQAHGTQRPRRQAKSLRLHPGPFEKEHPARTHSCNSPSPPKPPGPAPPAEPAWRSAPPKTSRCSTSSTFAATRS